jgi:hypothetical protein
MPLLLDDFTEPSDVIAARWSVFSDRVMGGVSTANATLAWVDGHYALRLTGNVSLENNGGFVQVARALNNGAGRPFDASGYDGIGLRLWGAGGPYFLHLRTEDCRAPWQYYSAPLPVDGAWEELVVPWHECEPVSLREPLDPSRLIRLGIVAAKRAFSANVAVARVTCIP